MISPLLTTLKGRNLPSFFFGKKLLPLKGSYSWLCEQLWNHMNSIYHLLRYPGNFKCSECWIKVLFIIPVLPDVLVRKNCLRNQLFWLEKYWRRWWSLLTSFVFILILDHFMLCSQDLHPLLEVLFYTASFSIAKPLITWWLEKKSCQIIMGSPLNNNVWKGRSVLNEHLLLFK